MASSYRYIIKNQLVDFDENNFISNNPNDILRTTWTPPPPSAYHFPLKNLTVKNISATQLITTHLQLTAHTQICFIRLQAHASCSAVYRLGYRKCRELL